MVNIQIILGLKPVKINEMEMREHGEEGGEEEGGEGRDAVWIVARVTRLKSRLKTTS